jgi:hypothetical protein
VKRLIVSVVAGLVLFSCSAGGGSSGEPATEVDSEVESEVVSGGAEIWLSLGEGGTDMSCISAEISVDGDSSNQSEPTPGGVGDCDPPTLNWEHITQVTLSPETTEAVMTLGRGPSARTITCTSAQRLFESDSEGFNEFDCDPDAGFVVEPRFQPASVERDGDCIIVTDTIQKLDQDPYDRVVNVFVRKGSAADSVQAGLCPEPYIWSPSQGRWVP